MKSLVFLRLVDIADNQQQYKTDFANDDFELPRRVWRSIETLLNESGKIRKASLVHDLFISI